MNTTQRLGLTCLTLAAAILPSCGSTRIAGRVVQGPAGIPLVVPASDPRVTEAIPVPGVTVSVIGEQGKTIVSALSAENGNFTISIPSAQTPTRAVEIRAEGPGIFDATGSVYLPRDGSWIIYTVKSDPAAASPR